MLQDSMDSEHLDSISSIIVCNDSLEWALFQSPFRLITNMVRASLVCF